MKIDTEIGHVTKPGANLFLELGFPPAEAKRLHAASRKQINDTRRLKEQLMAELAGWIEQHHLKQAEAAEILSPRSVRSAISTSAMRTYFGASVIRRRQVVRDNSCASVL